MGLAAWITVSILVGMLVLLVTTKVAADVIFSGSLTLLLVTGVVSPAQALSGFSNEGVVTVGVLYIVVSGLRETGGIAWLSQRLLGRPQSLFGAQLRLMSPVALMSAFLNNTPVVAMLVPAVSEWGKKFGFPASQLMIPLSYASILGGTCTLIGTSTNLVVNGLLLEQDAGLGMTMFGLARVGLPVALIGIGFILIFGRRLLPKRNSVGGQLNNPREYSVEMLVDADGPLVGQSIEAAGLRHLQGLYLADVERGTTLLPAVSPLEILQANDRLVFVGIIESVLELQRIRGLTPAPEQVFKLDTPRPHRTLVEAVVSDSCPLIGQSIREGRFRNIYGAVVIAVARNAQRIDRKIGDIVLRPGDTLLLETRPSFIQQQRNSRDFYLVSAVADSAPPRFGRIFIALAILVSMVLLAAFDILSLLEAALLAAGMMILTRCCSAETARRSVDWSVLIVIASAFGLGAALSSTGAASTLASLLVTLAGQGHLANLVLIYLSTALFSSVITNNAAAVLMFPIALATSETLGVSIMPFAIAIIMAASASFATPIGYQTNLMVYGPGGYRFGDYLKIGLPLNLITGIIAVLLIPLFWRF